jgi:hypothetical protein
MRAVTSGSVLGIQGASTGYVSELPNLVGGTGRRCSPRSASVSSLPEVAGARGGYRSSVGGASRVRSDRRGAPCRFGRYATGLLK